jgi:hypothetical protein
MEISARMGFVFVGELKVTLLVLMMSFFVAILEQLRNAMVAR